MNHLPHLVVLALAASIRASNIDPGLLGEIFGTGPDPACVGSDGKVCSDHGACTYGVCQCDEPYAGEFCQHCPTCRNVCDEARYCVLCYQMGRSWYDGKTPLECFGQCKDYKLDYQSEERTCKYREENCEVTFVIRENGQVEISALQCDGYKELQIAEGVAYNGQTKPCSSADAYVEELSPDGHGTVLFSNQDEYQRKRYVGDFECGKRHGKGNLSWQDGAVYAGEFVRGVRTGEGTMFYTNGDVYVGAWVNDTKWGSGKYIWASGAIYEGEFKNGKRDGQATYKFTAKELPVFKGLYSDDVRVTGDLETANGALYKGEFGEDGSFHGEGTLIDACGHKYTGEFDQGEKHGNATMEWVKGDRYVGEFSDGVLHGQGSYTWNDGTSYEGAFDDGEPTEFGKWNVVKEDGQKVQAEKRGDKLMY